MTDNGMEHFERLLELNEEREAGLAAAELIVPSFPFRRSPYKHEPTPARFTEDESRRLAEEDAQRSAKTDGQI